MATVSLLTDLKPDFYFLELAPVIDAGRSERAAPVTMSATALAATSVKFPTVKRSSASHVQKVALGRVDLFQLDLVFRAAPGGIR